jgi:hypothetical protein
MNGLVCVTDNLSEKIAFQMQAVATLKAEICGTDKNLKSKYIRDFATEFSNFESVSSYDELQRMAGSSRIIYMADYHALPHSQRFQARFVEDMGDRPLVLGLEMFYSRDQEVLNQWMAGTIDDEQLLRRVRYDLEWGYDWEAFRNILTVARVRRIPVFGIDCAPRSDLRLIHKRDAAVAEKIAALVRRYHDRTLIVSFGESHLASNHLPAKVEALFPEGAPESLTILQNVDDLYWKATCGGHETEQLVRVRPGIYCIFTTTPFEKYEAYRRQLEIWDAHDQEEERLDLTSTVYNLINTIADFLGIDRYTHYLARDETCIELLIDAYPEVYSFEEFTDFGTMLRNSSFSEPQIQEILTHTLKRGSCYIPRVNAIFIGEFNLVHGAEEAAHFVNFALKRQRFTDYRPRPLDSVDEFYLSALEEALGYFGSKLIDPRRDQIADSAILNIARRRGAVEPPSEFSATELRWMRRFTLAHKAMEDSFERKRRVPRIVAEGLRCSGGTAKMLSHELGYLLGEQIYRGYLSGVFSRREIRRLFGSRFEASGRPISTYLDLSRRSERLPL